MLSHDKSNRMMASNNGPVLPNRSVNLNFNDAFTAIRNMNLLPSDANSNNLRPSTPPQHFQESPLSRAQSFDDNASIRSAHSFRSIQSTQSAQSSNHNHFGGQMHLNTKRKPYSNQTSQHQFVPDSPYSIQSLPAPRKNRGGPPGRNPKHQFLSGYDPSSSLGTRPRRIVSANNTPTKRRTQRRVQRRRPRSHSHSRNPTRTRSRSSRHHDNISLEEIKSNFKVVVRCRPPLPRELNSPLGFGYVVRVDNNHQSIAISDGFNESNMDPMAMAMHKNWSHNVHKYTFDYVYPETADQQQVYETTAKHSVLSTLEGYNASIIAYGQTSAGKTYTMEGFDSEQLRGIIPRAIEDIFEYIEQKASPTMRFLVRASYLQIYNEVISDLLKSDRTNLQIREDKKKGVYVSGLSEWVVRSCQEIYGLIKRGAGVRATCATKLNEISSRSHAIFIIIVEQNEITINQETGEHVNNIKIGKLNLVDLAGSERVRISGAEGQRLEESKSINQSLSALGNVISALTESKRVRKHIPYRDSKLTRILEDSLGGNCKTTMMAMISPALEHYSETVSTLKFANRAKNIKNIAVINQDLNEKALLRKYEKELKRLKAELAEKSKNVVDKAKLLEVEEQRNKAERDKMTAIQYLERMSQDLEREKSEKHQLMRQIEEMNSKMIQNDTHYGQDSNGHSIPQTANMVEEYEEKLNEIEEKRHNVAEDKAQVQRYKQLLMKQRDIMIQLTSRLNDRDQSILALQEELDAYDNQQKMMENVLDQKTVKLIKQLNTSAPLQNATGTTKGNGSGSVRGNASPRMNGEHILFNAANDEPVESATPQIPPCTITVGAKCEERPQLSQEQSFAHQQEQCNLRAPPVNLNMSYINPFQCGSEEQVIQQLEQEKIEKHKLKQELKEVHADKTSLEYLLRCRINDMVYREVDVQTKRQEQELAEWRKKYENAEERRRNTEYLLELSRVGGKANVLHEQLTQILQKERSKVEEKFHRKIQELKEMLLLKDQKLHSQQAPSMDKNKTVFAELKKLKNLHNKFSKMQQRVEHESSNQQQRATQSVIVNEMDRERRNGGRAPDSKTQIMDIIQNENLSELVRDLKQLQNIEHSNSLNTMTTQKQRQHLKQSIEHKIRSLVDNLTKKVLSQQNSDTEQIKNDIIQAQQIINNSFDILN